MRASSAPAMIRANFAQVASKKNTAITTIAAANKKRQKHNFILTSPSRPKFSLSYKKKQLISSFNFYNSVLKNLEPLYFFSNDCDNFYQREKGGTL
jgi:hypothetical protein